MDITLFELHLHEGSLPWADAPRPDGRDRTDEPDAADIETGSSPALALLVLVVLLVFGALLGRRRIDAEQSDVGERE